MIATLPTGCAELVLRPVLCRCAMHGCDAEQAGKLPVCVAHAAVVPRRTKRKLIAAVNDPQSLPPDVACQAFEVVGRAYRAVLAAPSN